MPLQLEIKQHKNYLEFVVSGMYDYKDAVRRFPHVLDTCILTGQSRVLIDITQMQPGTSATEEIFYALSVEKQYNEYLNNGSHPLRVAYLAAVVGSYEPGRDIARIVGLPFDLFDNRAAALKWLEIKDS